MTKQYLYQFSDGFDRDYSVSREKHCKKYQKKLTRLKEAIPKVKVSSNSYTPDCGSPEWKTYIAFYNVCPEKAFQELHNMVEIGCTELWGEY